MPIDPRRGGPTDMPLTATPDETAAAGGARPSVRRATLVILLCPFGDALNT